jgi:O-methyltransferase
MRPFHLINVTWGENHTGLFLDVSLPTQLSQGNLPVLAGRPGSVYKIYAPADEVERISANASYQRLCAIMPAKIIEIEIGNAAPHEILTQCHKQAIRDAESVGAAIVFLAPDTALGDGAFATLARLEAAGKKAVMACGVRVTKESFVPEFLERFRPHGEAAIDLAPRDLCDLSLEHLHAMTEARFWPAATGWPSNLYWAVGRDGLICHCFHLHPMMVVASHTGVSFSSTIDGDYVDQACGQPDDVYVVTDSDELSIFEISSVRHNCDIHRRDPLHACSVGLWGAAFANRTHRRLFEFPIRIHRAAYTAAWDAMQAQSDRDVQITNRWLKIWTVCLFLVLPLRPVRRTVLRIYGSDTLVGKVLRRTYQTARRFVVRGPRKAVRIVRELLASPFVSPANRLPMFDPTQTPPPSYTPERAQAVYGEAFRRCFEYLKGTGVSGDIAEFGTLHGYTGRLMATLLTEMGLPGSLWLYDSFTGLPADMSTVDLQSYEVKTNKAWTAGAMAVPRGTDVQIRRVLARILPWSRVNVIKGYFEQTLPSTLPANRLALVHVDCDLYTSARYVLDQLLAAGLLQDGCVVLCDDYNCNRANPRMGERRAMAEAFGSQQRFSYSPFFSYGWHGQAFLVHDQEAVVGPRAEAA